jgi:hypothetical protein
VSRRLVAVAAVAALVVVAGCDGGDATRQETGRDAVQGAEADPAARLDAAVEQVLTSGRYRQTVTTPGLDDPYYEVTGAYDVDRRRFTADMAFWNPEAGETRRIQHRFLGARGFQQAQGWRGPGAGCWLVFDRLGPRSRATAPTPAPVPDAVTALAGAIAESAVDGSVVTGTVDVAAAMSLMLPGYLRQQAQSQTGTVPATFTLTEDGSLADWQVRGADLVPALDEAGQEVATGFAAGLSTFTLQVAYDGVGEPVTVQSPPRSLWMTARQMKGGRGCAGS